MTIQQEHTVVIDRPIEEVFAFVTDPDNVSLWQSTSLETEQTSEGPVGVGTTFRDPPSSWVAESSRPTR